MARLKITGYADVDEQDVDRQDKSGLTQEAYEGIAGIDPEHDLYQLKVSDLEDLETELED